MCGVGVAVSVQWGSTSSTLPASNRADKEEEEEEEEGVGGETLLV